MLEASVDGFCGAVAGAGAVEVGEDVGGALLQGAAEAAQLDEHGRDTIGQRVDYGLHDEFPEPRVGFPVGGDHPLVDAPGRLDLDMLVVREQCFQACLLLLGE